MAGNTNSNSSQSALNLIVDFNGLSERAKDAISNANIPIQLGAEIKNGVSSGIVNGVLFADALATLAQDLSFLYDSLLKQLLLNGTFVILNDDLDSLQFQVSGFESSIYSNLDIKIESNGQFNILVDTMNIGNYVLFNEIVVAGQLPIKVKFGGSLVNLEYGDADSGGIGYRMIRIPNGGD